MQFHNPESEALFRRELHAGRARSDRLFACLQVFIVLVILKTQGTVLNHMMMRMLLGGTAIVVLLVLAATAWWPMRYMQHRGLLLSIARLFFDVWTPAVMYASTTHPDPTRLLVRDSWFGFIYAWAICSRLLSALITNFGYLLTWDWELLHMTFGCMIDLLNNRRMARAIVQFPGKEAAFLRVGRWLFPPLLRGADGSDLCSPAGGPGALAPGSAAAATAAACYCETLFAGTQVLLALAVPLACVFVAERAHRLRFAAKHRRLRGSTISHDRLRLLLLLVAIQFRVFVALRFEGAGAGAQPPF